MSLKSRSIAVLAVAVAILCLSAITSPSIISAKVIEIRSCEPLAQSASARSGASWTGSANSLSATIRTSVECPSGLRFDTQKQASFGAASHFASSFTSGLAFDSIRFTYRTEGPDTGYSLTLSECDGCDPIVTLDSTGGAEVATPTIPLHQPTKVYVKVQCVRVVCEPSGEISLNSVVLRASDATPPNRLSAFVWGGWQRKSRATATFKIADPAGVGLGTSSARIVGSGVKLWSTASCNLLDVTEVPGAYYGPSDLCPAIHEFSGPLALGDLPDGIHRVQLDSTDGFGNQMPTWQGTLRIDDTPPSTPEDLEILPEPFNRWIPSSLIWLNWTNVGERLTTDFQSGLDRAYVDLRPREESLPDPPPIPAQLFNDQIGTFGQAEIPEDGEWDIYVWTVDHAGNSSGKLKTVVRRDSDIPQAPLLDDVQWLNREALLEGSYLNWTRPNTPELESGICGYAIGFDATPDGTPTAAITHPGDIDRAALPANLPAGNNWAHVRAVSCAGLASTTVSRQLRVDTTRPTVSAEPDESASWLTEFTKLTLSASDDASGVDGIEYAVNGGPKQFSAAPDLNLPLDDGEQRIDFRAADNAGNWSPWNSFDAKIDQDSPTGTFLARGSSDPTKLTARLEDVASGLAQAEIQIRRNGDASARWATLPANIEVDAAAQKRWLLSARIPDESLPAGDYGVRVVAVDVAGNKSVAYDQANTGIPMHISLPLRTRSTVKTLLAPVRSSCKPLVRSGCESPTKCSKPGSECVLTTTTDYKNARAALLVKQSSTAEVFGSLVRPDGSPMANVSVIVEARVAGAGRQQLGSATTDANGEYQFPLAAGPRRTISVSYAGSLTELPSRAQASLDVFASATLRARSRSVKGGRLITFYGQLRGKRAEYPMNEVMVILEFWNGRAWQTGIGRGFVGQDGRFAVQPPYFAASGSRTQHRVRVRGFIRSAGSGWPYLDGYTDQATVQIR